VQQSANVRTPDQLIVFASARGGDIASSTQFGGSSASGAWWSYGQQLADVPTTGSGHRIRPGNWVVRPPGNHPYQRGGTRQAPNFAAGWAANAGDVFNPRLAPSTWGMLDFRYSNSAVTCRADGSVKLQTPRDLRDMIKWANVAGTSNWTFPTNMNVITW